MIASILIVSKNRKEELIKTLKILDSLIDKSQVEVLVFLDGCTDNSNDIQNEFTWIRWFISSKSIGASAARNKIYRLAVSKILIGFDDDAHPLNINFVFQILDLFDENPNVGIIAFEEIKGIFGSDQEALSQVDSITEEYLTNEFIGCGFAIQKDVYEATNGFPLWIDIYGEESCLSIEVLAKGYDIMYSNTIKVNHRVNIINRKIGGHNYFRYGKQLKNTTYYYLVYYPFPLVHILKLYQHNFIKYALKDSTFFKIFFRTIFKVTIDFIKVLKYRNPVNRMVLKKLRKLSGLKF